MVKILSLFSGIGAFEKALDRSGIDYELVNYCEIDKYASRSYSQIHNVSEDLNLGDITTTDTNKLPKDIDLITHGSPCQSFSIAGQQEGGDKNSGTKSSLMWETVKIVGDIKPKIVIWENVKNVLSKKHKHNFDSYIESLNNLNYNSYYQVLNAKDYGIPQNRERIFVVSIRKDVDDEKFKFPNSFELKLRLRDILESNVDEKYYLKQKDTDRFKIIKTLGKDGCRQVGYLDRPTTHDFSNRVYSIDGIARTLMGSGGNQNDKAGQYLVKPTINRIDIPQTVKVRKYQVDNKALCECLRNHKANARLSNKDIAEKMNVPITMVEHWFRQDVYFAIPDAELWLQLKEILNITTNEFDDPIMIFEEREGVYEKSERHYFSDGIMPTLTSATAGKEKIITAVAIRGRPNTNGKYDQKIEISDREISNTVTTAKKDSMIQEDFRIRKLTAKECFRLMGFDDEDFERAAKVNSDTQLYKQAGNSIVVNVLEAIFNELKPYLEK